MLLTGRCWTAVMKRRRAAEHPRAALPVRFPSAPLDYPAVISAEGANWAFSGALYSKINRYK